MKGRSRNISEQFFVCSCSWKKAIPFFVLFTPFLVSPSVAQTSFAVRWEGEALSVTAEKSPLSQVLKEVADRTGAEIQGLEELQAEVSVRFSELHLREGLEKLLAEVNYLILEGTTPQGDVRPTLVLVFGRSESSALHARGEVEEPVSREGVGSIEKRLKELHAAALEGNVEALRQAMSDPNPTIQSTALDLLAERDRQGTVSLLVDGTKSKHAEVRFRALELLNNNSQADERTIISALREAVAGEDTATKSYAIRALAERGGSDAVGYLRQALHDSDPSVRMVAIDQIVRAMPADQRLLLLQEAAQDQDATVRSAASTWLEEGVTDQ
jgi:HEAT repeat protein